MLAGSERHTSQKFYWPVRVYYEDTDNGGVVYYANYLKFMERARTEWLRSRGFEQDLLSERDGLIFAVREANLQYLQPARFNFLLGVSVDVTETSKVALTFSQSVYRLPPHLGADQLAQQSHSPGSMTLLCKGIIKVVALDSESLKPKRMSTEMLREILSEQ